MRQSETLSSGHNRYEKLLKFAMKITLGMGCDKEKGLSFSSLKRISVMDMAGIQ
jgi:hypothetical protein